MHDLFHIQYPVGQGGLHLGIIGDVAYVYDCGAVKKYQATACVRCAANMINKSGVKEVHIFISHLHEDHCNSLEQLLQEVKIVNKIVHIPYIDNEEKLLILCSGHSIKMPSEFYIKLLYGNEDYENNENEKFRIVQHGKSGRLAALTNVSGWVFDYFVNKSVNPSGINTFLSWARINISKDLNKNDVLSYLNDKAKRKELKNEYLKCITTNLNFTSLCLYCGPTVGNWVHEGLNGWLHTGDYNLKDKAFWGPFFRYYKAYCKYIGWFQIPHHGSKNNISLSLLNYLQNHCNCAFFFTGQLSPKGRGQPKVFAGLLGLHVARFYKVTECPCSLLRQGVCNLYCTNCNHICRCVF